MIDGTTQGQVTHHLVLLSDSRRMASVPSESVDLIVTSPPYPMVEMWDGVFSLMSPEVSKAMNEDMGPRAFEACHTELDKVWKECFRVLRPGRFACINVGDAVRKIGGVFQLYSNHSRILSAMTQIRFAPLPDILWRKQTNAPNKFMGSGMLPAGAYVTYEHEYVLVLRKGGNRAFDTRADKENRRRSAYFWEERNVWFSDVWTDLKGGRQELADAGSRKRSGAYPFELPWRLIQMHSVYGDTVLDPFLGTGTTTAAAMAATRNSVGIELDRGLAEAAERRILSSVPDARKRVAQRIDAHLAFVAERAASGRAPAHLSRAHGYPVVTAQEQGQVLFRPVSVRRSGPGMFEACHEPMPSDVWKQGECSQLAMF